LTEAKMKRIALKSDGAILLGNNVSCDGFAFDKPVRVQTHIHQDHMVDFDTSKANQKIIMSHETRDLLNAFLNADLPYRNNILTLKAGSNFEINGDKVELFPSNHMLGGVQVKVTCPDGYRIGYSSDFFWPLDTVIDVDELIVDSTYGDPLRARKFTQQQADDQIITNVVKNLRGKKATVVIGHNGRIHHALYILSHTIREPILCSPRVFSLVKVYEKYGFPMAEVKKTDSVEGIEIMKKKETCLIFVSYPEIRHLPWVNRFSKITLSAHMAWSHDPVVYYSNGDCCIAMTDHADFHGTLEYVRASGASIVWTDPRSGNAEALAQAITNHLGIVSQIAPIQKTLSWG